MSPSRRDFVKAGAVAAAATIAVPKILTASPPRIIISRGEAIAEDLALEALNAAKDAGAQYADARIGRYRRQSLNTREHQITGDRKSTRLNSSHMPVSRMPSSA